MKKYLLILMLILLSGCMSQKYEETMKGYAETFYNLHIKGQKRNTTINISIKELKEANEVVKDGYDLEKLKKCADDSFVALEIDENTNIKGITYHLKCD